MVSVLPNGTKPTFRILPLRKLHNSSSDIRAHEGLPVIALDGSSGRGLGRVFLKWFGFNPLGATVRPSKDIYQSIPAVAKQHGDVDTAIFVTRFEFQPVRFMKEIGIEHDNAVLRIGNNHFPAIVFGEKAPDAFMFFVVGFEVPVRGGFYLVYDQASIGGVSVC